MGTTFHAAAARGCARHETLTSQRSFSFADYQHPQRMGFGALRVLNEEWLAPGNSVPLHAHENMEIISIPLAGSLRHEDSRGASHVIAPGSIHLLSAGRGITHWEHNQLGDEAAHYLQIWIRPQTQGTPTRYEVGTFENLNSEGCFGLIAAPHGHAGLVTLNQHAWLSLALLQPHSSLAYARYLHSNGVYVFLIDGHVQTDSAQLMRGDALAVTGDATIAFVAQARSTLLCIEVPFIGYCS
jgi:quercetin 2,3-dioxygenase